MNENEKKNHPLYGLLRLMSVPEFDVDAYMDTESFLGTAKYQEVMRFREDEGGAEAVAYWRERGLIKELHDAETVPTKWASYLPITTLVDTERRYPLLYVMHGSGNPILLAESYGFTHIAAREEVIVIIPEDETPENIDKLFACAKEHYPVDWSRVYMVGYSLGGCMTQRHAVGQTQADLIWEYVSQFARDPDTGRSYRIEK